MKTIVQASAKLAAKILTVAFLFGSLTLSAQPTPVGDSININNVSALMYANGVAFWNQVTQQCSYRVPKTSNACSIYGAGLWIGGLDAGGHLHTAASTYRQNGDDFWPGPVMDSLDYSSHQDTVWNKIWKINKTTIDSFRHGLFIVTPASILNWPGNGNVALGQAAQLAPYVDSNHNGKYDPAGGDYPLIRGDQAMYIIYNDDRGTHHGETGGLKLGVEVHLMAYQYNTPADKDVYQTTFLHYDVYNRSKNTYDSTYLGYWCDMDLGNGGDDFIGSDSANNYWYTYNGEATDPNGVGGFLGEIGYGGPTPPPPAQAVIYLCDTMKHFQYYNNDFTVTGNPKSDTGYYEYMKSVWLDKTHVRFAGNGHLSSAANSNYMYSGSPATGLGWTEESAGNPFGDRRGLSSVGPFTLAAGGYRGMDIALVYARANTGNQDSSVKVLDPAVQDVKAFYETQGYTCGQSLTALTPVIHSNNISSAFYPNPFSTTATLAINSDKELKNAELHMYDVVGREVYTQNNIDNNRISINRNNLQTGIYFYTLLEEGQVLVNGKCIVQ